MSDPVERFDETFMDFVDRIAKEDLTQDTSTTAIKNLKLFKECRPQAPEPEPTIIEVPVTPETTWCKVKAGIASAWDNETTRVLIKAGGAFAGVGLVVWTTVHKDHVMERNALSQANQRSV